MIYEFPHFSIPNKMSTLSRLVDSSSCCFFVLFFFFLLYNIVLVLPYINMHPPWMYTCSPSWTPLPPPSPYHPSSSSQYTSPKLLVSCIEPGLLCLLRKNTYPLIHNFISSSIFLLCVFFHLFSHSCLYIGFLH